MAEALAKPKLLWARASSAALALALAILSAPASAELSANEFIEKLKGGDQTYKIWLHGIATGLEWANSRIEANGGKPLWCLPAKLGLTPEQEIEMLKRFLEEYPSDGTFPTGMVLMSAYAWTFPCNRK